MTTLQDGGNGPEGLIAQPHNLEPTLHKHPIWENPDRVLAQIDDAFRRLRVPEFVADEVRSDLACNLLSKPFPSPIADTDRYWIVIVRNAVCDWHRQQGRWARLHGLLGDDLANVAVYRETESLHSTEPITLDAARELLMDKDRRDLARLLDALWKQEGDREQARRAANMSLPTLRKQLREAEDLLRERYPLVQLYPRRSRMQ